MSDIFISYSRKDIAFARLLHKTLKEHDLETWIDWQDIPPSTEWMKEIFTAIEEANTVIFILSESSILSEVCTQEIDHAEANNKRIIPIVIDDVEPDKVHPALAVLNWIFSRTKDELQPAIGSLIEAIDTDYDWVKSHTRLLLRALEWERADRDRSFLLQGTDLNQAENWLTESVDKQPEPTLKQTRYIQVSRQEAVKRQRRTMIAIAVALVVTIVLGILAVINGQQARQNAFSLATQVVVAEEQKEIAEDQRGIAEEQRGIAEEQKEIAEENARLARIRELTAVSQLSGVRFDVAMLLGAESFNTIENYQTTDNLIKLTFRNPEVLRILSHDGVRSVAISPDGKTLASGAMNGSIILWDISNDQPLGHPLRRHFAPVWSLEFSPDGDTLVSASDVGEIILWDVESKQVINEKASNLMIRSIAFSPDGKALAFVGEDISSYEKSVNLWIAESMQPTVEPLPGLTGWTGEIAFSPGGEKLACGFGNVIIWDLSGEQPLAEPIMGPSNVMTIAFSPDGKTLAAAGEGPDRRIILWDVESKLPIGEPMEGHASGVSTLAFSPDGKTLASGGWDRTIILWDVSSGQTVGQPLSVHIARIAEIVFSPDGKFLISVGEDGAIIIWNLEGKVYTGEMLPWQNRPLINGGLSVDGKTLAVRDDDQGVVTLIDVDSGLPVGDPLEGHASGILSFAFSPDGKTAASVDGDGSIYLWDSSSGVQVAGPLQGHSCREGSCDNIAMAFSPDGKILASGGSGEDSEVILWDASNGQPIGDPVQTNIRYVTSVAFSPDGNILTAGFEGGALLWEINSRQPLYEALRGHTDWVTSVVISPDGNTLASGGGDGNIILWDIASGQSIGDQLRGYAADSVMSMAFSPDGKVLASGFSDGSINLWEVASGKPLGPALHGNSENVRNVAFRPDGKSLVSAAEDGSVFIWDADPESWLARVCERAGRNFTHEEWEYYFPDEPYRRTCELWPEGR